MSPSRLHPGDSHKVIDVTVATVALDITYNGQTIGPSMGGPPTASTVQGDRCFYVTIDGSRNFQSACGSMDVPNLAPGQHTVGLQDQVPAPGAMFTYLDVQSPVTVTLIGGQSTPVSFDISAVRGEVDGAVQINGQAPADYQYNICIDGGGCGQLMGGAFKLFVRPGSGVLHVRSMMGTGNSIVDIPYTATAGATTDLGTINVEFGSVALDLIYNGASIGPSMGGPPTASAVQGDRCFYLVVDGTQNSQQVCGSMTLANLTAGQHTVLLRDQVPTPGAMFTYVDVQPQTSVTVVANQSTPLTFDISGARGKVTGVVHVNGQAPPDYQYNACLDMGGCGQLFGGAFNLFARVGSGNVNVRAMQPGGGAIANLAYTVSAAATTDLGTTDVQLGSVAIDVTYNGATIGPSMGGPPTASTAQGDRCFYLTIDGVANAQSVCGSMTLANITPGAHTLLLRDQVPAPGAMFNYVDVQPATTVTVAAGQSTPVTFDISAVRGQITGVVHINGQAPPDYQYNICLDAGSCGQIIGGSFDLFARVGSGKAALRGMMGFNNIAQFTFIVAAGKTTIIGGLSTAAPGSTPAGTSVDVLPINQSDGTSNTTVTMNFSDVTTAGTTTVLQSATGAPPPTGLQLGTPPVYFDLSTTATFSGPVQVCINYTGTTFPDGTTLALLHGDGAGNWTDVTTSVDPVNRIICGSVTSFSPFVVASRTSVQAPTITPKVTGTAGTDGWYTSDVSLTWTVAANGGTLSNESGCDNTTVTSNTSGETFTCSATNAGGNTTKSITIKRDATSPAVTPTVSGPLGDNGWYRGDVAVSWSSKDETSGIVSGACASSTLASDNAGTTYSCSATNGAGLSTTGQVTVKRDATKPVVQYSGNAGGYTVDQNVAISCSADDAMSGVASTTCQNVNAGAYTLPLGTNTLSASAVDRAGNEGLGSTSFTVSVTTTSLCNLTRRWTSTPDVASSLCAKLDAAAASRARGNANAAQNQIGAYINEVRAQSGKNIPADSAAILLRLAGSL